MPMPKFSVEMEKCESNENRQVSMLLALLQIKRHPKKIKRCALLFAHLPLEV
eukprot:jgi/Botrbrau1/23263/Bobra.0102s0008.1